MNDRATYDEVTAEQRRAELASQERVAKIKADADTKISKNRLREERHETYRWAVVATAICSVILGIAFLIYRGTSGPENADPEPAREEACLANGGGWVPEDLFEYSDSGLCVYPGKTAK